MANIVKCHQVFDISHCLLAGPSSDPSCIDSCGFLPSGQSPWSSQRMQSLQPKKGRPWISKWWSRCWVRNQHRLPFTPKKLSISMGAHVTQKPFIVWRKDSDSLGSTASGPTLFIHCRFRLIWVIMVGNTVFALFLSLSFQCYQKRNINLPQ